MQIARAQTTRGATPHPLAQARLEGAVQRCLHESGYSSLSSVGCSCWAGTAVLTGQVPSFYMKQVAQTIAFEVDGVEQVDNLLDVVDSDQPREAIWI